MGQSGVDEPGGGRLVESHADDYRKIGESVAPNRKKVAAVSFERYLIISNRYISSSNINAPSIRYEAYLCPNFYENYLCRSELLGRA